MDWNNLDQNLVVLIKGAITTVVIVVAASLVWYLICRALGTLEKHSRIKKTMLVPIRLTLRYGVIIIALLLILRSAFGVEIGNFWTFVSTLLGLVAIGFVAVWSVLSNISSTFFLFIFKPFGVGDYVKVIGDDVNGEVIDVDFMFTTLRSHNGDIFKVPNNHFFQKTTLRPIDPTAFEAQKEEAKKEPEESIDHSQQNLEGVKMPTGPAGRGSK